jgi:type IV pilus biogenesis protein PilP
MENLRGSEPTTIRDLTEAQQTLARLEILYKIEQKLSDIETEKQKRMGGGMDLAGLAAAVPPMNASAGNSAAMQANAAATAGFGDYAVARIFGRSGKLGAVVITPDGREMTVKKGSSLPDGGTVTSVSTTGVKIKQGDTTKTIQVTSGAGKLD